MNPQHSSSFELENLFFQSIERVFNADVPAQDRAPEIPSYLTNLMLRFLHSDRIFDIRDEEGRHLQSVAEMVLRGDVRYGAESFEEERRVHQHIGDFILFWSGVFPEFLRQFKSANGKDLLCDYSRQAKESYHLVSTFDFAPHENEAKICRRLSSEFDTWTYVLRKASLDVNYPK